MSHWSPAGSLWHFDALLHASPLTPLFLLAALALGPGRAAHHPARGRAADQRADGRHPRQRRRPEGRRRGRSWSPSRSRPSSRASTASSTSTARRRTTASMVTARFLVGTNADDAILRVHEKIRANIDRIPIGIPEPLIVGRGINDVAVVVLTLSPKPEAADRWTDKDLYAARREAARRADQGRQCRPDLHRRRRARADPGRARPREALALRRHAAAARRQGAATPTARSWPARSATPARCARVAAGQTLPGVPDIGLLLVTTRDDRPVYVRDVANVVIGPSRAEQPRVERCPRRDGMAARARGQPRARQARRRQCRRRVARRSSHRARRAEGRA